VTVVVTGHRARLGNHLVLKGYRALPCDVTDLADIKHALRENFVEEKDTIIHCAAITDVDACEGSLYSEAIEVNILGVNNVRTAFKGQMIYISTDYVFDGKNGPYSEEATPNPICHYGETKLLGEETILEAEFPRDVIVRTTILYGGCKPDFVSAILKQLKTGEQFRVTGQLMGSPTYVPHLVEGLRRLVKLKSPPKIVNIAGMDVISRWIFASGIAKAFGYPVHQVLLTMNGNLGSAPRPKLAGLKVNLARALDIPVYSAVDGLKMMAGQRP
jgi:dTDP-4-dehydrorhamnose reductase